jgi:hypothetical protein
MKGGGALLHGGALLRCLCGGGTFTAMSVEAVVADDALAFLALRVCKTSTGLTSMFTCKSVGKIG